MKPARTTWLRLMITLRTSGTYKHVGIISQYVNPLKTSPEYTRAGVYGKCVL